MIRPVAIGQLWQLALSAFHADKITARVSAIDGNVVHLEVLFHGEVKRTTSTQLRTLMRGLRGARLVRNADGSDPEPDVPDAPQRNPWAVPKAIRAATRPRGVLRRPLSARQLRIERLIARGIPLAEIARRLGVCTESVRRARTTIEGLREAQEMGLVK